MNETHSLVLNEDALQACPEPKRPAFVHEWLRHLDRILPVTQKSDLKSVQKVLLDQLRSKISNTASPPTRQLLARCLSHIYKNGDTITLFETINSLNDLLKGKDDSSISVKLTALACLAALFESLGRLVGRTYEDTFYILLKSLKHAEAPVRAEIFNTYRSFLIGLGSAASGLHKDLYKAVKQYTNDRVPYVRVSAIKCLQSLVPVFPYCYNQDIDALLTACTKALEGSTYETRLEISKLIGLILASAMDPTKHIGSTKPLNPELVKPMTFEEALQRLCAAFLRGGAAGGFLKSTNAVGYKEVKAGLANAYVELAKELGSAFIEKNINLFCKLVLELASKCGTSGYNCNNFQSVEMQYNRTCISFILRSVLGGMLSEQAQILACKFMGHLLSVYNNSFAYNDDIGVELNMDSEICASSVATTVALLELSVLVRQIGTAVTPLFIEASGIMEPIFLCLLHPTLPSRTAAAWCLRCITLAVPSQLTPLINKCLNRLEHMKASSEAISGHSLALAALVAGSVDCKLGMPCGKTKQVFNAAENMLKTATSHNKVAVARIHAGWLLIESLISLGHSVVSEHMPKVIKLWQCSFPRSVNEAKEEPNRGDGFTWQCNLESRAGALATMGAVAKQRDLIDPQLIEKEILPRVQTILTTMNLPMIKQLKGHVRASVTLLRARVYQLLLLLPARSFEKLNLDVMREAVADITLADYPKANQLTGLSPLFCSGPERVLLVPYMEATDHGMLEDHLSSVNESVGALENDPFTLVSASSTHVQDTWPEPDSTHGAAVDAAILVYAKVFPAVSTKNRLQITHHFTKFFADAKSSMLPRQQVIQANVITALGHGFKGIAETKTKLEDEELKKIVLPMFVVGISSQSVSTRCVSAEAIGRFAQAVGDPQYIAQLAQLAFDKLSKSNDTEATRAGYALMLGCLHRHGGSLGSGHHLNTAVGVLLGLAQNKNQPMAQSWALIALALIAETGGSGIRGYVDSILGVCLTLLLTTPLQNVEVIRSVGKLLTMLITCVGPELCDNISIDGVRTSLLASCAIQLAHEDPLVKEEAMSGFQQIHLFAQRYVDLPHLVVDIAALLNSPHLCVRKAAVGCLRQLVQREAREVREHVQVLVPQGIVDEGKKLPLPDTGLEGALFAMLDNEVDSLLRFHIQETLTSLVLSTSSELLNHWLSLCKDILASSSENVKSTLVVEDKSAKVGDDEEENEDDDVTLQGAQTIVPDKGKVLPRWPTRVFAMDVVQKLLSVCDTERAHLDLALAKELQLSTHGRCDYLVLHLSDLVRMSFMGATSDNTELRLAGLQTLQEVINRFSAVPEPEFPGHLILEQFQAQVGAALRPAFSDDTPSHVTAAACQVCSTWIASGVARDLNDLRRVHQLLVSSLSKLQRDSINTQLYSESAATLEKLSILKAWGEVYVTALATDARPRDEDEGYPSESLLSLVKPELESLVGYWLAVIRDASVIYAGSKSADQIPQRACAFFKVESFEVVQEYYRTSWPPILLATSLWLKNNNFVLPTKSDAPQVWSSDDQESRFVVILGITAQTLSSKTTQVDDATIHMLVRSITVLLSCEWCQLHLMSDVQQAVELCYILHRLILTRDSAMTQQLCLQCAQVIIDAAMAAIRISGSSDVENGNVETPVTFPLYAGNDGENGELKNTLSYALLELCWCLFVRQMPQIDSAQTKSRSVAPLHLRRFARLPPESTDLIQAGIQLLVQIPNLVAPVPRVDQILPIVLHLLIAFVKESAKIDENCVVPDLPPGHLTVVAAAALQGMRKLASSSPSDSTRTHWLTRLTDALFSLLKLCDDPEIDQCVLMLSCTAISSVAPPLVVLRHTESFNRLIRLIRSQLRSEHPQVVCKALQSVMALFNRREICSPFIKHLVEPAFTFIKPYVMSKRSESMIIQLTDDQLQIFQDAIKVFEVLAGVIPKDKQLAIVDILSQSLMRVLLRNNTPEKQRQLTPAGRRLQEYAIERLTIIAPLYSAEFREILGAHPELKAKVEHAMQLHRNMAMQNYAKAKQNEHKNATSIQQPTIKLKMDFNAFQST